MKKALEFCGTLVFKIPHLYVSIFYETAGLFRASGFLKFEILDIHEASASEIDFYEMSSSATDM